MPSRISITSPTDFALLHSPVFSYIAVSIQRVLGLVRSGGARRPRSIGANALLWLAAVLALSAGTAAPTSAQAVAGLGEDAIPVPARGLRLVIGARWDQWDKNILSDGSRVPLLSSLNTPAFGPEQLPSLGPVQSNIRQLAGATDFSLSLGPLEAAGGVRRSTSVLRADYGITKRVSVGVRVPYVEVVHDARLVLNRDGISATVGANPALRNAGAAATNGGVHFQLGVARTQLMDAISSCSAGGGGDVCDAIASDPAAANALIARTEVFRTAWLAVYGDGTTLGAPVVPVQTSAAHAAISAAVAAFRTDYGRYFQTSIPPAAPLAPTLVYGSAGLQEIAQDSAFGINADTLDRAFRAGMGDVDLEARVLLFDSWNADQAARLATRRSGFRVMASGGWRFGSASSTQTNQPFALSTGDGVSALLLRATADAVWKHRAWVSATVRSTTPIADNAVVRLPGPDIPELFFLSAPQATSRSLGQRIDLEIAPRINLGEKFGVSATWLARTSSGDRYAPLDGGAVFETPSSTAQYGAVGITYSTLAAFSRGKSKHAVEVLFAHEVALSASGVSTPSLVRDRLELRIYTGFPRR